jgi:hypothetical protein
VKEGWEGLDSGVNVETVDTLGKEGVDIDVGMLMDRNMRLHQPEVSVSPALLEHCDLRVKYQKRNMTRLRNQKNRISVQ